MLVGCLVRLPRVDECRRPPSMLDLANKRVLPNSPHASSGGGWAGRPCSESGSTQGEFGFAPPATSVALCGLRRHPLRWCGGEGRVPGDAACDDHEQLPQQGGGDGGAGLPVAQRGAGGGGEGGGGGGGDLGVPEAPPDLLR